MSRKFFTLFEHHQQPLASGKVFLQRVRRCCGAAIALLAVAIFMGAAVYHYIEGQDWVESVLNAVMIMTGLGLVDTLHATTAKLFTCFYAVFSALVFYIVLALFFAPLIHRFLHEFHLEVTETKGSD